MQKHKTKMCEKRHDLFDYYWIDHFPTKSEVLLPTLKHKNSRIETTKPLLTFAMKIMNASTTSGSPSADKQKTLTNHFTTGAMTPLHHCCSHQNVHLISDSTKWKAPWRNIYRNNLHQHYIKPKKLPPSTLYQKQKWPGKFYNHWELFNCKVE